MRRSCCTRAWPSSSASAPILNASGRYADNRMMKRLNGALRGETFWCHVTGHWRQNDWVAFLGAWYFRAIGEFYPHGLSARGVALDVDVPDRPEEFPAFTNFWFEPSPADSKLFLRRDVARSSTSP